MQFHILVVLSVWTVFLLQRRGVSMGGFPQSTRASTQPTANVPQFAASTIHGQPRAMTQVKMAYFFSYVLHFLMYCMYLNFACCYVLLVPVAKWKGKGWW